MSQPTFSPFSESVAFAQETGASSKGKSSDLKELKRNNSFFAWKNLRDMVVGVRGISAEYVTYLVLMTVFAPFIMFGGRQIFEQLGIVQPLAVTIGASVFMPLALLALFLHANANKEMAAKRKAVAGTRRAAERLDRKVRPVLTSEHVILREKLDDLFQRWTEEMSKAERTAHADDVFALMLEDIDSADEVVSIVEERGVYTSDEVQAIMIEMRELKKPLQDGAL